MLRLLSYYIIPIALLLGSVAALFVWEDLYSATPEQTLDFQVIQSSTATTPEAALAELEPASVKGYHDTKMSEAPVWFSFRLPTNLPPEAVIEFPSRHARDMSCWDASTLNMLGYANSRGHSGAVSENKSGFALNLRGPTSAVVCQTSFIGPARLAVHLWDSDRLDISTKDFHRQSGWLDGGMLVLALFVLVTAFINRRGLYVIFAAWLLLTLRISATSAGWDFQWLNHAVPEEWISHGRSLTRAAYAVITITLF
ncbi:MAG: diguanylate cyclase, partial [Hylemonella sp.]